MEKTMSLGLVGRKVGMTRIFTAEGDSIPVTVLDVSDNRVTQIKTVETDGYTAVQVAFGTRRASRVTKPLAGHLAKAGVQAGEILKEFQIDAAKAAELSNGTVVGPDLFEVGQKVDVQGVSIGKGYAGTIKRYNFASGRASHGNSRSHNVPGSIGMAQDPGRVFPGKRMTGHMGDDTVTVQNLEIARIDADRKLLLVKGAVPGAKGGKLLNANGQEGAGVSASDVVFGRDYNEALIHQVVVAYQANARSGNRAQKDREQVKHTTKKPWRQKGTGRARAGMSSSPLWRGGGRIFPNSPEENFSHKVNKKMHRAGLCSIFSQLAREGRISVVDELTLEAPKTKLLAEKFKAMGLDSVLVITDTVDENLYLASRNLAHVAVVEPRYADPLSLIYFKKILITKAAVAQIEELLS
ncbi:hypothetical protein KCU90_g4146, partial [Aureobasidium melanogenum]